MRRGVWHYVTNRYDLRAAAHPKSFEYFCQMQFDGGLGQAQRAGDLFVGMTPANFRQNFTLARR
jgi:hypothetical protein